MKKLTSKFTHLHLHTDYSILDGCGTCESYAQRAAELGFKSLTITDHGNISGAFRFYNACQKYGIKPIIGCEIYVNNDRTALGEKKKKGEKISESRSLNKHLVLLSQDDEGYINLCKIVSEACVNGFYYRPRTTREVIRKYNKGLVCLSACMSGEPHEYILKGEFEVAEKIIDEYKEIFGDRYYLEIEYNEIKQQLMLNSFLMKMAKKKNIKTVATVDCHYVYKEDNVLQDALLMIQSRTTLRNPNRWQFEARSLYLKTPEEMYQEVIDLKYDVTKEEFIQQILNTQEVADKCNLEFEFGQFKLPKFLLDQKSLDDAHVKDHKEYLRYLCIQGLKEKFNNGLIEKDKLEIYKERLKGELSVIIEKNFEDYFLMVEDIVKWSKENDIYVGAGRGCFLPGSKVRIYGKNKYVNIEDIKINEKVLTYNREGHKVLNKFKYQVDNEQCYKIKPSNNKVIKCTYDHKIMTKEGWKQACELTKNDILIGPHDEFKIDNIKEFYYTGPVYDIEVKDVKNYTISDVSVHNSAAGSLVSYLLKITNVNPLKFNLIFERFLNPGRTGSDFRFFAKGIKFQEDTIKIPEKYLKVRT